MDLVELRLLAVGGILTVGVVASSLGIAIGAAIERLGRIWRARNGRAAAVPAVGPRGLGAGGARC
jgi:hypothetical protein